MCVCVCVKSKGNAIFVNCVPKRGGIEAELLPVQYVGEVFCNVYLGIELSGLNEEAFFEFIEHGERRLRAEGGKLPSAHFSPN